MITECRHNPKLRTKIKQGDLVVVIAGKDKGRQGSVKTVLKKNATGVRLVVEGVNIVKRHTKGNPNINRPSEIVAKEAPIDASNVQIFNQQTQKADRIGYKFLEDGRKVRVYRSTGEAIDANV